MHSRAGFLKAGVLGCRAVAYAVRAASLGIRSLGTHRSAMPRAVAAFGIFTGGGCAGSRKTLRGISAGCRRNSLFELGEIDIHSGRDQLRGSVHRLCRANPFPADRARWPTYSRSPRILRIQDVQVPRGPCSRNTRTPSFQACSITRGKSSVCRACAVSASATAERLRA